MLLPPLDFVTGSSYEQEKKKKNKIVRPLKKKKTLIVPPPAPAPHSLLPPDTGLRDMSSALPGVPADLQHR